MDDEILCPRCQTPVNMHQHGHTVRVVYEDKRPTEYWHRSCSVEHFGLIHGANDDPPSPRQDGVD